MCRVTLNLKKRKPSFYLRVLMQVEVKRATPRDQSYGGPNPRGGMGRGGRGRGGRGGGRPEWMPYGNYGGYGGGGGGGECMIIK